jgi:hypothetical protein
MMGRIIGREGRNIKSFEGHGTTISLTKTPDSVSSPASIRAARSRASPWSA